jgi:uncharacterized protein (DUF2267 family)
LELSNQQFEPDKRLNILKSNKKHDEGHVMPVPLEYQRASHDFYKFLEDAKDTSGLTTTHQVYTMAQGVLQVFRRRLDVKDAILFANVLPPVLRAIFVADWDTDEDKRPFEDRAIMTKEVQSLRADHNFAPESSIHDVAIALRQNVDEAALDSVLAKLPDGAVQFWHP